MSYWHRLPDDVLHIVLDYADILVYRFGKYMQRIPKTDTRYQVLNDTYVKHYLNRYHNPQYTTIFMDNYAFSVTFQFTENRHYFYLHKYSRFGLPETRESYILSHEGDRYYRVVSYSM